MGNKASVHVTIEEQIKLFSVENFVVFCLVIEDSTRIAHFILINC